MLIAVELIIILLYMYNALFAFALSCAMFLYIFFTKRNNKVDMYFNLLLLSSPLFSVSIIGDSLHHIVSWPVIFLVLYMLYLLGIRGKEKNNSRSSLFVIIILFSFLFIKSFLSDYVMNEIVEIFQLLLMVLPIYLTYTRRYYVRKKISDISKENYVSTINKVTIALSLATIIQFVLYNKGVVIGEVSYHSNRIIFDTIFKGYSVLSIFLSIGIVINVKCFFDKINIKYLIGVFIPLLAIILNSSRAGLAGALIISLYIILKNIKKKKYIFIILLFTILSCIIMYKLFSLLLILRGDSSLITGSGRIITYQNAFKEILSSIKLLFIGGGLSSINYSFTLPHNCIIQFLLTMGLLGTSCCLTLLISIIKKINESYFLLIVLCIIIGTMLITDFYANVFFTIFVLIGLICSNETNKELKRS